MKKSSKVFTPVERIDGVTETRNMAEKYMHLYRYQHAARRIRESMPGIARGMILDIACGYGYGSKELNETTKASVIGVDISRESVMYATKHYGVKTRVEY